MARGVGKRHGAEEIVEKLREAEHILRAVSHWARWFSRWV